MEFEIKQSGIDLLRTALRHEQYSKLPEIECDAIGMMVEDVRKASVEACARRAQSACKSVVAGHGPCAKIETCQPCATAGDIRHAPLSSEPEADGHTRVASKPTAPDPADQAIMAFVQTVTQVVRFGMKSMHDAQESQALSPEMESVCAQLIAELSNYAGERGESESAFETLQRIIRERDANDENAAKWSSHLTFTGESPDLGGVAKSDIVHSMLMSLHGANEECDPVTILERVISERTEAFCTMRKLRDFGASYRDTTGKSPLEVAEFLIGQYVERQKEIWNPQRKDQEIRAKQNLLQAASEIMPMRHTAEIAWHMAFNDLMNMKNSKALDEALAQIAGKGRTIAKLKIDD